MFHVLQFLVPFSHWSVLVVVGGGVDVDYVERYLFRQLTCILGAFVCLRAQRLLLQDLGSQKLLSCYRLRLPPIATVLPVR